MWSNGKQCAVVLTWNFDAEALWFGALNMNTPGLMERGAYGTRSAFQRITAVFDRFPIPQTFYVPAWVAQRHEEQMNELLRRDFEIGYEGFFCESVVGMSEEDEANLIDRSLAVLEKVTGRKPKGSRVVPWDHNLHTARLLLDAGFTYDSSLTGDDNPYLMDVAGTDRPLIQLPVSWELDDFTFFEYVYPGTSVLASNDHVFALWKEEFDRAYSERGLYLLTLHPQIIGKRSRIGVLEKLLADIIARENVWFATALEAAEAWHDGRRVPWPPAMVER